MNKSEMCEAYEFGIAYWKGYNQGVKDFAKLLIDKQKQKTNSWNVPNAEGKCRKGIDNLVKEMVGESDV